MPNNHPCIRLDFLQGDFQYPIMNVWIVQILYDLLQVADKRCLRKVDEETGSGKGAERALYKLRRAGQRLAGSVRSGRGYRCRFGLGGRPPEHIQQRGLLSADILRSVRRRGGKASGFAEQMSVKRAIELMFVLKILACEMEATQQSRP